MDGLSAYAKAIIQLYTGENKYGYVYGAQGEIISPQVLEDLKRKYGSAAPNGAKYYEEERVKKWIGHKAADCSGLVMVIFQALNIYKNDMTANDLMVNTIEIEKDDLSEGDLAFKTNVRGQAVHVGIYIGGGVVVHARGTDYGVVATTDNEFKWSKFGRLVIPIPERHWAQPYYDYLQENDFNLSEKRFNDPITRGEFFAATAKGLSRK